MPIPFTCPHCGTYTIVDDRFAGQTTPCASCGQTITIPAGPAGNPAYRPPQCTYNLKQIALAMHNYHDTFKCFPSAVLTDEDGNPRRSWRVTILPFVEQTVTYDNYNFDEPWDSASNQILQDRRPSAYTCPSDPALGPYETNYVMITGKGTIGGEPNETVSFADIRDGTYYSILAIEVAGSGISWMEPRDMSVDEAVAYITNPSATGLRHVHPGGVNVAMADASVIVISSTIDPQVLRNLLTRDDGQVVNFYRGRHFQ